MLKNKMISTLFALCLITCGCGNVIKLSAGKTEDSSREFEALLKEYVDENDGIGAVVGLIDQGKTSFFSYGKKSIRNDEPMSLDTVFEIGSLTKVFTTLLLMDMVSKGEIQLDEPIETYLPGINVPEKDGKKITLKHLATHYSGLPRLPDNFNPKNPLNPYKDYTFENLYDFINQHELQRAPEEQFEYSNLGMGLLGAILIKQAGLDFESLIQERICKKLEMTSTAVTLTEEMQKHFAQGYDQNQEAGPWDISDALAGAGAIRSNIQDMTRFLSANMGLINSELNALLQSCHQRQNSAEEMGADIGLGWILFHSDHADIIWHNGGTGGFRSFLGFNPKTQQGVVILSNSTGSWPDAMGLHILDPLTYPRSKVDRNLARDANYLKKFEGSYESTVQGEKMEITIQVENSDLIFVFPGGNIQLQPISFGLFRLKGIDTQNIRFVFDAEGNISKAEMVLSNGAVVAEILPKVQ